MSESGFPGFKDLQDVDFIHSSVLFIRWFIHLSVRRFIR